MTKPISKQSLYSMISSQAKDIIQRVVELTKSDNESVALGACKLLLNKAIPDIKGLELKRVETVDAEARHGIIEVAKDLEKETVPSIRLGPMTINEAEQIINDVG